MQIQLSPLMFVVAAIMGIISAYLAHRRGKDPYIWFLLGALFGYFGIFALLFTSSRKRTQKPVQKQPVFRIDGPPDKFWYYLDPEHNQLGPMSRDALTSAWKSGKINLSTFVWHEDLSDWKPLKDTLKVETI